MKLMIAAVGLATLATGMASSAEARPMRHPVHHKQCKWVVQHHHKVKRCW